jgi:hypothetical protein
LGPKETSVHLVPSRSELPPGDVLAVAAAPGVPVAGTPVVGDGAAAEPQAARNKTMASARKLMRFIECLPSYPQL